MKSRERKIIHIDMDAFYASVEQRDFPDLRGKPIAVGGGEKRGVITTASYEARVFGVRSAMPGFMARSLCPQIVFVKPRFEVYRNISKEIRSVFKEYTDLIEPLSMDEAYLDVTNNKVQIRYATQIANNIKKRIFELTGLTCSAGVSYCKFLAKVASGMNKPNGLTIIKPNQAEKFIESLPIEKFYGVGKVTSEKMRSLGILNGRDLRTWSQEQLIDHFGKQGVYFYSVARGIDNRPVEPNRPLKSVGVERTLDNDIGELDSMQAVLDKLIPTLFKRLAKREAFGRTLTLKVKTVDFKTLTRSKTVSLPIDNITRLSALSQSLLQENYQFFDRIRLMGLTVSKFDRDDEAIQTDQMSLFE